jgi:ribokinase
VVSYQRHKPLREPHLSIPKIAVVGSYATGLTMKVKRLPSTGETVLGTGYRVDYGGKGSNQAVGCARLGACVSFVAKIGNDSFADMAMRLYREEGIDTTSVQQVSSAPTGIGFILVEEQSGHNCIALDPGANELLNENDIAEHEHGFRGVAVLLTQLEIPADAAKAALMRARAMGITTILNPAPVRPVSGSLLREVDILTPNLVEAKVLAGLSHESNAAPAEIARELLRQGVRQVVITLGEKGAIIVTASAEKHVPAIRETAVDTTGAGDAFNAGLATALAHGASIEEAVQFAVVTGGLAVTREGVIPSLPRRAEVIHAHQRHGLTLPTWLATDLSVTA